MAMVANRFNMASKLVNLSVPHLECSCRMLYVTGLCCMSQKHAINVQRNACTYNVQVRLLAPSMNISRIAALLLKYPSSARSSKLQSVAVHPRLQCSCAARTLSSCHLSLQWFCSHMINPARLRLLLLISRTNLWHLSTCGAAVSPSPGLPALMQMCKNVLETYQLHMSCPRTS